MHETRRSPTRRQHPTVSFADIGGLDDTIEEIKEIAIVPSSTQKCTKRPVKTRQGHPAVRPPGVGRPSGKALLAKPNAISSTSTALNCSWVPTGTRSENCEISSPKLRRKHRRSSSSTKSTLSQGLERTTRANWRSEFSLNYLPNWTALKSAARCWSWAPPTSWNPSTMHCFVLDGLTDASTSLTPTSKVESIFSPSTPPPCPLNRTSA